MLEHWPCMRLLLVVQVAAQEHAGKASSCIVKECELWVRRVVGQRTGWRVY